MRFNQWAFEKKDFVKIGCINIKNSGYDVRTKMMKLYPCCKIPGMEALTTWYLELEYYRGLVSGIRLYEDLGFVVYQASETIDAGNDVRDVIGQIHQYPFFGFQGILKKLKTAEEKDAVIQNMDIKIVEMSGDTELAEHYRQYRLGKIMKSEELE